MNLFGNLSTEGLEQAEDRLGGFTSFTAITFTDSTVSHVRES
jgi:hypothetical protein